MPAPRSECRAPGRRRAPLRARARFPAATLGRPRRSRRPTGRGSSRREAPLRAPPARGAASPRHPGSRSPGAGPDVIESLLRVRARARPRVLDGLVDELADLAVDSLALSGRELRARHLERVAEPPLG